VIVPDVNVLVYAARPDAPRHAEARAWLERVLSGPEPIGLSELVLSGVVRVLTHPRIFDPPTSRPDAVGFVEALRRQPQVMLLRPGERHWPLFLECLETGDALGNLVADAYHAALVLEHGAVWVTTDRDFARFPRLRWRQPSA
jgi:toxin-antitoxin system PIN domain toxin